jgi:hypothetical protein
VNSRFVCNRFMLDMLLKVTFNISWMKKPVLNTGCIHVFGLSRLRAGRQGFNSRQRLGIFLFVTVFKPALRLTQPPIQWEPGPFSPGVKWLGRETDRSPSSSAKVKNAWRYTSTFPHVFMAWYFVNAQELYLTFACQSHFFKRHLQSFADLWPTLMGFSIYI